MTDNLRLS